MIGTTLGPYKILEQLGAGGMGEVWLAEDSRLDRKVAIKVLPTEYAADPERLARFEQEAKAAAGLNHPHIAAVYDIGFDAGGDAAAADDGGAASGAIPATGTHYIVQEYLQGQSLRDRLGKGALPLAEALELSVEVGEALVAAHDAGIVHRDIKPDNIFVTQEGHAKVLDFGLAKLTEQAPGAGAADLSMSPTVLGTVAGQVMGTAGYMSPEQIEGGEVDARTDIFGFGCVLYEMVTGQQPFAGRTVHHTLDRVLSEEPTPVREINAGLPPQLAWILQKCLAKPASHRYQHADDLVVDFVALRKGIESGSVDADEAAGGSDASTGAGVSLPVAAALGAAAVIAIAAAAWFWLQPETTSSGTTERFELLLDIPGDVITLAEYDGKSVAVAPDGSRVVFVGNGSAGRMLYVRYFNSFAASPIPGTEGGDMPFFSPDSSEIAFFANRMLKKVGFSGARPVDVVPVAGNIRGGDWREDGAIVFGHSDDPGDTLGLKMTDENGTSVEVLTEPERGTGGSYRYPQFLPGDRILMTIEQSEEGARSGKTLAVYSIADDSFEILEQSGTHARYLPTGHLVYARNSELLAVPIDIDTLEPLGNEVVVLQDVYVEANVGYSHFDSSRDGTLVYSTDRSSQGSFVWVDRNGTEESVLPGTRQIATPRISPDGTRVTFWQTSDEIENLWIYDLTRGGEPQRLTPGPEDFSPEWFPDGETILFGGRSYEDNTRYATMTIAADFTGSPELVQIVLPDGAGAGGATIYSYDHYSIHPDGAPFTLTVNQDIWLFDPETDETVPFFISDADESAAAFSPDGNWIAYVSNEEGPSHVYVRAFPSGGSIRKVSIEHGDSPVWSHDGTTLFYISGRRMMEVSFDSETGLAETPIELFQKLMIPGRYGATNYDVAEDGRLLMLLGTEDTITTHLNVVLNWFDELRELAPVEGGR